MSYMSLFATNKQQSPNSYFAKFTYNGSQEQFWSPFQKLADMAKPEDWDFPAKENKNLFILRNYLNFTFLRTQQLDLITYSEDRNKACFNTGLQTTKEKDIFAIFNKNKYFEEGNNCQWYFHDFVDSYSEKLNNFNPAPKVATYYSDTSDLVFDLSYDIEINYKHIIDENKNRLPPELKDNSQLALTAIQGATQFLTEKIRRNYKIAIPHWYDDRVQLLLPLYLMNESKADLALVADKDKLRKIYRIVTALDMEMAYIDARVICRQDKDWLISQI